MGVSYDAMTYIGVEIDGYQPEAIRWLKENTSFTDAEIEDCIEGMRDRKLEVQCHNYYSGRGYSIGFEVNAADYKNFDTLLAEFKLVTGVDGEVFQFEQVN